MEVHAHSHTERKKWYHYLWEFLMLFLAVFCGFLAENQREYIVEHQRAKVYAFNLLKELQKDTARLTDLIQWTQLLSRRYDTICLLNQQRPPITNGKLYYYSNFIGLASYFSSDCSTMEQLKNSGNLRILSTVIALKISDYDRHLKILENNYNLFKSEYETINGLRLKIFDGIISINLFLHFEESQFKDSVYRLNPPLINNDPGLMKEYIGWVKSEATFWVYNIRDDLEPLNNIARELILLLQKEYHLK